jgi:ABC-type antimicrobial peptide transport system permease subunit
MDPDVPVFDVRTFHEHLFRGRALFGVRLGAIFGLIFGLLALTLAAVGVYGVISYSVSSRTREIGIRIALGARMASVLRLVVRQGFVLCLAGLGVGIVIALAVTRVMSAILYDVSATNPFIIFGAAFILCSVASLASLFPARRAAKIDPARALRAE